MAKEKKQIAKLGEKFKQSEFIQTLTEEGSELFLLKCTSCGGTHFRHAGYMHVLIPFVSPKEGPKVADDARQVQVCVNCKTCYIIHDGKIYDVTKNVDLQAWEKTEKEAFKATGPGGQC